MKFMDTEFDFIKPEFLNILFFQQKNLIIFPYVDLKHLKSLETFTIGHSIVDLESTALYNIKEIIFEANNSYSQNPTLFFIYNLDNQKVVDILSIEGIRYVLNTNDDVSKLVDDGDFIFYNKKTQRFINYDKNNHDLEFEKYLFSTSENMFELQEKVQQIKIIGLKIFSEINNSNNTDNIPKILEVYPPKFWNKILNFVKLYYKIEIPEIDYKSYKKSKSIEGETHNNEFYNEYEFIISTNKIIAREFIQLLHEYRSKKVNPSNLRLDQLYNPQKLYNYLRIHHWKKGIAVDFLKSWYQMLKNEEEITDFEGILKHLNVPNDITLNIRGNNQLPKKGNKTLIIKDNIVEIEKPPSVRDFSEFKKWILNRLNSIEKILDN